MVEFISPPDSPIILTFGQLIAVTKFGRRSPLTGPQILKRCVRGLSRKRCRIVTIADHSNQKSCPLALAVSFVSLVTSHATSTDVNGYIHTYM